jgi:hypothetical protein
VVYDQILKCGGAKNIVITKNMFEYCKHSNRKYRQALEEKQKLERIEKKTLSNKRKMEAQIKELEIKKKKVDDTHSSELEKIEKKIFTVKKKYLK